MRRSAGSLVAPVRSRLKENAEALPPEERAWGCCAASGKVTPSTWRLPLARL